MATPTPVPAPARPVPSWFRRARTSRGLTIWETAHAVGMNATQLSMLERGLITRPELEKKLKQFFANGA